MNSITAVSYINTYPFIYGLEKSGILPLSEFELNKVYPSLCAKAFIQKSSDVVLMPSGTIENFNDSIIIKGYCIGAVNEVKSVLLLSNCPIDKVDKVLLDYQSTTSVKLLKILFHHHWEKNVHYISSSEGYENNINGTTAGLIIGDRAMKLSNQFPYVYDLAAEWLSFTQLPFVFAYWTKTKNISEKWLSLFNQALNWGLIHKLECLNYFSCNDKNLLAYLDQNISYDFDKYKIEGLKLFYKLSKEI
ncbi:MAG TPA: menaquinone biosynthesis protein [Bacteroidales bacterium]|nr:menaquinone biosynthesis protein [Bacteroidales bacterium]